MLRSRPSPWLLCAVALVAGCGGGGGGLPVTVTPPPPTSPPSTSPPTITTQPTSQTVAAGGSASFTVVASNGPLAYQWLSAPSPVAVFTEIPGATSATYTVSNVGAAQNGLYYRVIVSNPYGSAVSDPPVQLVVTGLSGGGSGGGTSCGPWLLAAGTEVRTSFTTPLPPGSGESVLTVADGVTFEGRLTKEVRLVQPLLTTQVDVRLYGDPDAATGNVTQYGSLSVVTSADGTTTQTVKSVLVTPSVDRQFALAAGQTASARNLSFVDTSVTSVNGVDQPPVTTNRNDTAAAVTFNGLETVTVPAGTFTACKYTTAGAGTQWLLRGYGSTVKDSSGGQATQIRVNGTVITGN